MSFSLHKQKEFFSLPPSEDRTDTNIARPTGLTRALEQYHPCDGDKTGALEQRQWNEGTGIRRLEQGH